MEQRLIDAKKIVYSWTIDTDGTEHDGVTLQSIINKLPTVNAIIIPDNATNGDMIKAMFPNGKVIDRDGDLGYEILIEDKYSFCSWFDGLWWNSPYKRGE